ncbi:tetratricopeptide repeat protein [Lentzea sp. NPDC005914]|uniref:tetratricopeptide repeat protein n=1 Tax=Lentzea sp. NPDC005914 TaxID=3154572 RepID=UPI0033F169DA
MSSPQRHLRLRGARRADRQRHLVSMLGDAGVITAVCHHRLRGPYTGVDTILRALLPDALRRWPELVAQHHVELLYGIPELAELIGPAPSTLASAGPFSQRTRFYGAQMIRCMSQGVVTFLIDLAARRAEAGDAPLCLVFEDMHAAEPTTSEFVALLARRCDPATLRVVVSTVDRIADELAEVLDRVADEMSCEARPEQDDRSQQQLVAAYVRSDGTSDSQAEIDAYHAADPAVLQRLHDERADELEPGADWGTVIGAVTYHRERGEDPHGRGQEVLDRAFQFCVETGFSAAVVDLGIRGRVVTDPVSQGKQYLRFTQHAASALVALDRLTESLELYMDLRARYTDAKVHMTASYGIAMLHTRFFVPRDHEAAVGWQNNAYALASLLPDPAERRTYEVFQANGLALVEMHRGNLARALELVDGGIARLDDELDDQEWVLHRSQLFYNRARLHAALGRSDEAYAEFTELIDLDPLYTDYLSERAKISRKRGDLDAALADYDRAVQIGPPFPELYYNRGTARLAVDDVDGAFADFAYVLEMEPGDVDTRLTRAELLLSNGDVAAAHADVVAGLVLAPDEPRLLAMLGTIELEQDQPEQALPHLDAALAGDPRYPAALVNRAVAHFRLGHAATAVDDLTQALDVVGADPDVLLNRGMAYLACAQAELAMRDFDAALALPGADLEELNHQLELCR